jgi:DNA-binding CsgD family transcriptional regulator
MNANAVLTKRESEVAELLAWGVAKKEVAEHLFISTRTVENTARNIYAKVGIQKATELCVWWFCTKFGISFDLSPVKRTVVASIILFSFAGSTIWANPAEKYCRMACSERAIRSIRRSEFDNPLTA